MMHEKHAKYKGMVILDCQGSSFLIRKGQIYSWYAIGIFVLFSSFVKFHILC